MPAQGASPSANPLITQPLRGLPSMLCLPIKGKNSDSLTGLRAPQGSPTRLGPPQSRASVSLTRPWTPQGQKLLLSIRHGVHFEDKDRLP